MRHEYTKANTHAVKGHNNYMRGLEESARQNKQKKPVIKKVLNIGVPNSCLISMKKTKMACAG